LCSLRPSPSTRQARRNIGSSACGGWLLVGTTDVIAQSAGPCWSSMAKCGQQQCAGPYGEKTPVCYCSLSRKVLQGQLAMTGRGLLGRPRRYDSPAPSSSIDITMLVHQRSPRLPADVGRSGGAGRGNRGEVAETGGRRGERDGKQRCGHNHGTSGSRAQAAYDNG
jgi:hypothetical protein